MNSTSHSERDLIQCFRGRPQLTRAEIQELTGFSRVTVSHGIKHLLGSDTLIESAGTLSHGGRNASYLSLNENSGYVGIVYFSATSMSVAISNIKGEVLKSTSTSISIEDGPDQIFPQSIALLKESFKGINKSKRLGVIIGVPGPVSHELGKVVSPPIMRGWDKINFHQEFHDIFGLPTYLENDANLLAIAEHRLVYPNEKNLILVKIATGIGSGLILNNQLHRGSNGSAGDIGHIQLDALKGIACRCGHTDCVESFASGWALVEKIRTLGYKVENSKDIAELCRKGDTKILNLVTEASSYIGHALADAVNLLNPSKIVITGSLVDGTDLVLATIKESVYQRAGALATKNLQIETSQLGEDAALLGSAQLGLDQFFYKVSAS